MSARTRHPRTEPRHIQDDRASVGVTLCGKNRGNEPLYDAEPSDPQARVCVHCQREVWVRAARAANDEEQEGGNA